MARQRRKQGKYENVREALHPGGDFLPEGRRQHGNIEIAHARLQDPSEFRAAHLKSGKFQIAMVNVARDPLEREYRYGRIDGLQHAAGRRYRDVLAWAAGRGDPGACGLRSASHDATDYKMTRMMDAARAAASLRAEARQLCGPRGEMILSCVLGDELSFRETANKISSEPGAPSFWRAQAGVGHVARAFRDALRALSDEWFRAAA